MRLIALSIAMLMSTLILGTNSTVAHAAPAKKVNSTTAKKMVKIEPGDSLSTIAAAHNSTVQRLFDANTAIQNPDLIYPGDQVRIPTSDEQLTIRPMPVAATPVAQPQAVAAPVAQASPRASVQAAPVAGGSVWDQLAQCESGGNWSINTGNGYYGGLQFSLSSWLAVGGSGLPSDASREEQIMRAETLKASQGWGAWPACTLKLGLR
jgi:LysM repeat protein